MRLNLRLIFISISSIVSIYANAQTAPTQYIYDDSYSCNALPICSGSNPDYLACVSQAALNNCNRLQGLNQNGLTLNDSRNSYIETFQNQNFNLPGDQLNFPTWQTNQNATTLFPAYTITYNPDPSAPSNRIGYPVRDQGIEEYAYNQKNLAQCSYYVNNDIKSYSPWVSHCSAFAEWAISSVFGQHVPPAQTSEPYDWCGLADKNADGLQSGENNWQDVTTSSDYSTYNDPRVTAQVLANKGCAVVANLYNSSGAGHIGVILPNTWQQQQSIQQQNTQPLPSYNFPPDVAVSDSNSFANYLQSYGPEEMQAGLYNFAHTSTLNGFYSELNPPMSNYSLETVMSNFNNIHYYYNTQTCSD